MNARKGLGTSSFFLSKQMLIPKPHRSAIVEPQLAISSRYRAMADAALQPVTGAMKRSGYTSLGGNAVDGECSIVYGSRVLVVTVSRELLQPVVQGHGIAASSVSSERHHRRHSPRAELVGGFVAGPSKGRSTNGCIRRRTRRTELLHLFRFRVLTSITSPTTSSLRLLLAHHGVLLLVLLEHAARSRRCPLRLCNPSTIGLIHI